MWRVSNWVKDYEKARTKSVEGPLDWVAVSTDLSSLGYGRIVAHERGSAHLGAWLAILELAARLPREMRGTLWSPKGVPYMVEDLEVKTRIPKEIFSEAIPRLIEIGWMEVADPAPSCAVLPDPAPSRSLGPLQDRTLQNRTVKRSDDDFQADLAFEKIWLAYPVKGRTKRPISEAQFVELILSAVDRPALAAEILQAVEVKWSRSKLWADGFVTALDKFLREHRWKEDPEPAQGKNGDRWPDEPLDR